MFECRPVETTNNIPARFLRFAVAASLCLAATARAEPGEFDLMVDSARNQSSEDKALQGYVMLQPGASHARAVGTIGRAYSQSHEEGNTVWGVVTEAINFAGASGHMVGTESAVANMAHDNVGELRGVDVVFKNRGDAALNDPVPTVGQNRYNDHSAAVYVSAQPRSPAGEYSGWQAGIKFGSTSLDRSASVPWTAAIDASEVQAAVPFYLVVWRCGKVRCGLKPTDDGATIVTDIDNAGIAR
jgi:hypothetical protein